jgi:hypothetical protein
VVVTQTATAHSSGDPTSAPPATLNVSGLSVKLNFTRQSNDTITISGQLPVTKGFKAAGSVLALDVAGVSKTFMLTKSGSGKTGTSSVRVRIKSSKGVVADQNAPFSIVIKSGDYAALAAVGLTNANHAAEHSSLPIMLVFNQALYEATVPVTVNGTAGKSLLAKK